MKANVGTVDKAVRILIALVIIWLYSAQVITGTLSIVLLVLAVIFILTAIVGFCPLYVPFGIKTCKSNKKKSTK